MPVLGSASRQASLGSWLFFCPGRAQIGAAGWGKVVSVAEKSEHLSSGSSSKSREASFHLLRVCVSSMLVPRWKTHGLVVSLFLEADTHKHNYSLRSCVPAVDEPRGHVCNIADCSGTPVMNQNIILLTNEAVSGRSWVMEDNVQRMFRHMIKWRFGGWRKEIMDIWEGMPVQTSQPCL